MEFYKSKFSNKKSHRNTNRNDPSRSFRNSRDDRYSRNDRDDRYSRDDKPTTVTCSDCGTECTVPFVPRTNKPIYCNDCFRDNRPDSRNDRDDRYSRNSRNDRDDRYSRDDKPTTVTCSDCGTECTVPFVPRTNKPIYCNDCFRDNRPDSRNDRDDRYSRNSRNDRDDRYSRNSRNDRDDRYSRNSRNDRDDRYSRNDQNSRSSRRESNRDDFRSKKPQNEKFLRKQQGYFSNGSDKFYETMKGKLYEILGGKTCSNCGFKDERALGISPISENGSFDNFKRGGDAASWGKYVSSPELARKELKVFCLNCNQIREPISKQTVDGSRPKPKKSKYFPR